MYVNHSRIMLVIRHYGHHDLSVRFPTVLCSANYLEGRLETVSKAKNYI